MDEGPTVRISWNVYFAVKMDGLFYFLATYAALQFAIQIYAHVYVYKKYKSRYTVHTFVHHSYRTYCTLFTVE
jgi:hypothetical protein